MNIKITGTGIYLPPYIETSKETAKLINKSELFYKVDLNKVPISINLRKYLSKSKKKKINFIA